MSRLLPVRRADVMSDSLPDGSGVLYDPCNEQVYAISSTATWVWEACDGAHEVESLMSRLLELFDTNAEIVGHDIGVFVKDLELNGLIEDMGGNGV